MNLTRIGTGSFIAALMLAMIALGITFRIDLVRYGLYIMIAAAFFLIYYVQTTWMEWQENGEVGFTSQVIGLTGAALLALELGRQVPIPKKYAWIGAALLLLLGAYGEFRGERK